MTDAGVPVIDLNLPGPSEREWAEVCASLPAFVWPPCERVVVVSPHPDDETLGSGGIIAAAARRGLGVAVLSVTDGEAAFGDRGDPQGLASLRRSEVSAALAALVGDRPAEHRFACVADGAVAAAVDELTELLAAILRPSDLVIAPLPDDGHPDHAATARSAAAACAAVGAVLMHAPIWAWHCHDPADTSIRRGLRVELTGEDRRRKRLAVESFPSQTAGPDPIVPPAMIRRLTRDFEVLVPADEGT